MNAKAKEWTKNVKSYAKREVMRELSSLMLNIYKNKK